MQSDCAGTEAASRDGREGGNRARESTARSRVAMRCLILLFALLPTLASGGDEDERELVPSRKWQGDYPVAALSKLPLEASGAGVGFIAEAETWSDFWRAFRPGESVPALDFERELVLYSRNLRHYNRTSIMKILVRDGVAEILAIETLSSRPIESKLAFALAAVSREGIRALRGANALIEIPAASPSGAQFDEEDVRVHEPRP